jgi:hypothetical protein
VGFEMAAKARIEVHSSLYRDDMVEGVGRAALRGFGCWLLVGGGCARFGGAELALGEASARSLVLGC